MTLPQELARLKEVCEAGELRQSDESLCALASDVGMIVNPSLLIAASVASELMLYRTSLPKLISALEVAVGALKQTSIVKIYKDTGQPLPDCEALDEIDYDVSKALAQISKIMGVE